MSSLTSDGLGARGAPFREQLAEAFGAVWLLVAGGEPLSCERGVAVGASEAFAVPRLVLVRYASLRDDLERILAHNKQEDSILVNVICQTLEPLVVA